MENYCFSFCIFSFLSPQLLPLDRSHSEGSLLVYCPSRGKQVLVCSSNFETAELDNVITRMGLAARQMHSKHGYFWTPRWQLSFNKADPFLSFNCISWSTQYEIKQGTKTAAPAQIIQKRNRNKQTCLHFAWKLNMNRAGGLTAECSSILFSVEAQWFTNSSDKTAYVHTPWPIYLILYHLESHLQH